jgi:probable phosphomutase (TIGR03848 family)
VPTVLLVRHGRTAANATGVLAGFEPGVGLDDVGLTQARSLAARLAVLPLAAIVCGPLLRSRQTADILMEQQNGPSLMVDDRLTECDYGDWMGRPLRELSQHRLWRVVQAHPSGVTFPGGESLRAVQARAVDAVREHDARASESHGPGAIWVAVSHGDVIKCVVADALGLHLDHFQRLIIDPGSVTALRYTDLRPYVMWLNHTGGELSDLRPRRRKRRPKPPSGRLGARLGRS